MAMCDSIWDIIGSIGTFLGAVATFAAVVVALRSSRALYTPKVKARCSLSCGDASEAIWYGSARDTYIAVLPVKITFVNTGVACFSLEHIEVKRAGTGRWLSYSKSGYLPLKDELIFVGCGELQAVVIDAGERFKVKIDREVQEGLTKLEKQNLSADARGDSLT